MENDITFAPYLTTNDMTTIKKTIEQWVKTLPPPVAARAMNYRGEHWDLKLPSFYSALTSAFSWKESKEGADYWIAIHSGDYKKAESILDSRKQNSIEAYKSIEKERFHKIILTTLHFSTGMTKDEISANSTLTPEQVHKRMSELVRMGKVEPNGKRKGNSGRNQTIWKIK